ncbi:MAG: hypothetical protein KTR31_10225 [Myxococcales bacterium]|nr:hypothetical protein [Myxococcales bacterium]
MARRAIGRLVYNEFEYERVCGWYQRVYRKITISVSAGLAVVPDLFERGPPDHEARCLTDLEGRSWRVRR